MEDYDSALQSEAEGLATAFESCAVDNSGEVINAVDPMRSSIGEEYSLGNGRFGFYFSRNGQWIQVALSRVTDPETACNLAESNDNGDPYTGALVIAINDTAGEPAKVAGDAIAEIFGRFGAQDLSLNFRMATDNGPVLYITGPAESLSRISSYADANYPRLAAEWEQI